jgi:hypothetical protein
MGLSRKRQREFTRLKHQAEELLQSQREVLEHASGVVREARHQAANYAREEVTPRVKGAYESNLRPVVSSGLTATRTVASSTRDKIVDDVLPSVSSTLAAAIATLEASKSPQVRDAIKRVSEGATKVGTKVGLVQPPKSSGPGKYILIGVGVVAAAGVAYAVWQTLRADDDLWIDDEADATASEAPDLDAPGAI